MEKQRIWKGNRITRLLSSGILAYLCVLFLPEIFHFSVDKTGWSYSYLGMLVWFLLANAIYRCWIKKKYDRAYRIASVYAIFLSICLVWGTRLDLQGNVDFKSWQMWLAILSIAAVLTIFVRFAWDKIEQYSYRTAATKEEGFFRRMENSWNKVSEKKKNLWTFAVIILCWLPVFLAVYPGFFVYDAQDEYLQVVTREFTTHHPLLHVLLLGGMLQAGYKMTDSYNVGIACYTICQMIFLAGIFTYVVWYLRKKQTSLFGRVITVLYFGLFPVIVMFSLCSAKDGIFTGLLLLLIIQIIELCVNPARFFNGWKHKLVYVLSAAGMMLFRHNGVYAYLVFIPVLIWFVREYRRKTAVMAISAVLLFVVSNGALTLFCHASASENQELLTVPIQQLARTYVTAAGEMTQTDKNTLYEIIPQEALEYYAPKVSDGVKINFNNEAFAAERGKYVELWFRMGAEHPFTYLNAWLMTSYGFWYPDTIIDVYRGNSVFTYTYGDSSYFGYEVEQPGVRESKIPWLDELYRRMSLEISFQKIPVVSMLFSPGFLFWFMLFVMGYLWYEKRIRLLIPLVLVLLLWMTVILGPTYLVRYVLFLWFLLPVFVVLMQKACRQENL